LYADAQHYGALKLSESAKPVLKGERTLMLRRQAPSKKKGKVARFKGTVAVNLHPADAGLFDALRQWRGQTAREQGLPAYVILHDKTLHELAARRPQTIVELLNVAGIGEAKAARYGAALLELLKA